MSGKPNGTRRHYTGVSGRRPDLKKIRVEEAKERLVAWQALPVAEQVSTLDRRLGEGQGAKKQRARLAKLQTVPQASV